ncbi:MAG: hypothetical protein EXQ52_06850 [Bryobacterales bacterium]|nr:hypothetical protein [Bryobacterales bacterium]
MAEADDSEPGSQQVPWYIWCSVAAVTSAIIGTHWDISWHRSIGRDTFWTPAHIAIYLCGVLAGAASGYLILVTTAGSPSVDRGASVRIWGFRGPLGTFISAWGGLAMLTSAPFDDWWHEAYGLDVKILSPPHVLLITGILAVQFGALILILGHMNRSAIAGSPGLSRKFDMLFLYTSGLALTMTLVLTMEYIFRVYMHSARFYRVVAIAIPVILAAVSRASKSRWAATVAAAVYSLLLIGFLWILPLFPAEPKLGPVYREVKNFIPAEFPLLLIAPAIALDLILRRVAHLNRWIQSAAAGTAFLAVFTAVQWPFATLLMSPAARNWFLGSIYFDFNIHPASSYVKHLFYSTEQTPVQFWAGMAAAAACAVLSTRVGIAWGEWMTRIRR